MRLEGGPQALQEAVEYPEFAWKAGIEGRVVVEFTLNETGEVTDPQIREGTHQMLNEAALDAIRRVSFDPVESAGQSTTARMTLPVTFQLPETRGTTTGSANGSPGLSELEIRNLDVTSDEVTGRIFDPETEMPVAGVNVRLPSVNEGAATAPDGRFALRVATKTPERLVVSRPTPGHRIVHVP